MAANKGKDNIVGQIVVAVVIALLVGGSAPWWWKEVFPARGEVTPQPQVTSQPSQPVPQPSQPVPQPSQPVPQPAGCVVTIANPLVTLMSEPSRFSQELVKVKPGQYTSLDYKVVKFGSQDQGWFQIEVEDRKGWIADDTWTIDSKTAAC